MLILAADTSLPILSVALLDEDALIGSVALEGKGSRNEKLLPAVDWILTESGVGRDRVDLLAVTRGPGSFTGVRIALATMQGLALALGRPLCAMSTHEAVALGSSSSPNVVVIDDAGRGEHYVSRFENGAEVAAPRLATAEEAASLRQGADVVDLVEFVQHGNVALACARRASQIATAARLDRYADISPIYVRLAEAEIKLMRRRDG
jgi:tRNA threonylcarbamoyladenosine biosynthesis protein TsaB